MDRETIEIGVKWGPDCDEFMRRSCDGMFRAMYV